MYKYSQEKPKLFTEEGSVKFTLIRDRVKTLLFEAEAFTMGAAIRNAPGDPWVSLACVDRLVELGELKEIRYGEVAGQNRIFIRGSE